LYNTSLVIEGNISEIEGKTDGLKYQHVLANRVFTHFVISICAMS